MWVGYFILGGIFLRKRIAPHHRTSLLCSIVYHNFHPFQRGVCVCVSRPILGVCRSRLYLSMAVCFRDSFPLTARWYLSRFRQSVSDGGQGGNFLFFRGFILEGCMKY